MKSRTWCPRLTAAIILSGSAVQVKVWDQDFSATMAPLRAVAGGEALRSSFNAAVRGKSTTIERGCDLLA